MPTVLHIASVFPSNSNRLALQVGYARDSWRVELLHLIASKADAAAVDQSSCKVHVLPHVPGPREGDHYFVRRLRSLVRRIANTVALCTSLLRSDADIVHAHENSSLWAIALWVIVLRRPAVWDPHDYFHESRSARGISFRLAVLKALERAVVRQNTPILSVSEGMREKYVDLYPGSTNCTIRNYSSRRGSTAAGNVTMRCSAEELTACRYKQGGGKTRLVYPGLIKPERFPLDLIRKIGSIDRVSLDIYGEDRSGLLTHQSALQKTLARANIQNIHLRGPYTSDNIVEILRDYHFAIFPYTLTQQNIDFCLPNKFYQCIEAGLPLITTNMKEMGGIIERNELGYVFPSGDGAACLDLLNNRVVGGDDYCDLVRNVLTYQSDKIDYGHQKSQMLDVYAASMQRH